MNERELELIFEIAKQTAKRAIARFGWRSQPTVSALPIAGDLWQIQLAIMISPNEQKMVKHDICADDVLAMRARIDTVAQKVSGEIFSMIDAPEGFWKQYEAEGVGCIQSVNN